MKNLFLFILCSIFALKAQSQTGWLRHFSAWDTLISVQTLADGYAFLAKNTTRMYQIRVSLDGQISDTTDLGPTAEDLVPSSDGNFYKGSIQNNNIRLQKLDATGALIWEQLLADTLPQHGLRLAATPDGGCYIGTNVLLFLQSQQYQQTQLQRINATGVQIWKKRTDGAWGWGPNAVLISDMVVMPDTSCLLLIKNTWTTSQGGAHFIQVKQDGTDGFIILPTQTGGGAASGETLLAGRPIAGGGFFGIGTKYACSSGGHPACSYWGFTCQTVKNYTGGLKLQEKQLPATYIGMLNQYRPQPVAGAPLPDGDALIILKQEDNVRLVRSTWDLRDSIWERALTPQGGFMEQKIKNPNRLIYGTADHGAIVGGVDNAGIFLQKIGLWGNDSTGVYFPASGTVLDDQDFDCQTAGPYSPLPNARVRISATDSPVHWTTLTNAQGKIDAYLPSGHWRAAVVDSIGAIFGKNCISDVLFQTADTLPDPDFQLPVLRYKARLKGRIWFDSNANCLLDEPTFGISYPVIQVMKGTQTYLVAANTQGVFNVAVDTGKYQLQIWGQTPGIFHGYYCQSTEANLPAYQSTDSVTLVWSALKNSKIRINARRDVDYNCIPEHGEENWVSFEGLLKDGTNGEQSNWYTDFSGWAEKPIYGPGDVQVGFLTGFGDSLICSAGLPHTFHFMPAENDQTFTDTLTGKAPRFVDTIYLCPGHWVFGHPVTKDTVLFTYGYYLNSLYVKTTHHVYLLPATTTHLYVVDTTLLADSLQVFYFTAVNGCDSTVYVHFVTSGTTEIRQEPSLIISPNPTTGLATLQIPFEDITWLVISDLAGKVLRTVDLSPGNKTFDVSLMGYPPGMYVIRAFRKNGACLVGKVVLE